MALGIVALCVGVGVIAFAAYQGLVGDGIGWTDVAILIAGAAAFFGCSSFYIFRFHAADWQELKETSNDLDKRLDTLEKDFANLEQRASAEELDDLLSGCDRQNLPAELRRKAVE